MTQFDSSYRRSGADCLKHVLIDSASHEVALWRLPDALVAAPSQVCFEFQQAQVPPLPNAGMIPSRCNNPKVAPANWTVTMMHRETALGKAIGSF
jgi:hypothetical protein